MLFRSCGVALPASLGSLAVHRRHEFSETRLSHLERFGGILCRHAYRRAEEQARQVATQAIQSGDMRGLQKAMDQGGDQGSLVKAFLYNLIGFKSGAAAEVAKMNLPGEWKSTYNPDTNEYGMVQFSTSGKPLQGVNSDNTPMTPEQMAAHAAGGGMAKNMQVSMTPHQAMVNGEMHTFSMRRVGKIGRAHV